jgi:cytochrome b561
MMIKGGTAAPMIRWAFVLAGLMWIGMTLTHGLLSRPGPKLQGMLRTAFPWMHWAMYGLLGFAVLANAAALTGFAPIHTGWTALLILLGAATLHGLFHFWRHNVLYDGALRKMTPRFMHKML